MRINLGRRVAASLATGLALATVSVAASCGVAALGDSDAGPATRDPGPAAADVFFPERLPGGEDMMARMSDRLVLDDRGCLRVRRGGYSPTVVWPAGFEAEEAHGKVRVLDREGEVVARVGRPVRMSGGETSLKGNKAVDGPTRRELRERCPGVYWVAATPVGVPRRG